jgi:hypothetical protein
MDNRTIFTKTAKGLGESIGKTKALSRESRRVIVEVNGVAAFKDLLIKLDGFSKEKLTEILTKLKDGDYIREFNPPPVTGDDQNQLPVEAKLDDALTALTMGAFLRELAPPVQHAQSLDFTSGDSLFAKTEIDVRQKMDTVIRADVAAKKKAADSQSQQKLETRLSKESEEKKQRETDAKAKKETDEIARRLEKKRKEKEAEDKAWQKFEAKAKEEADALARQKVEEDALKSIAEMQQQEAELAIEERARIAAEENAKKINEEKAKQVALETEKREKKEAAVVAEKLAAAQKQKDDEDRAWRKFEEKAKKEAEEKLQHELEKIAEEFARQAKEDQAKKELEEKERIEAEEKARQEAQLQAQKDAEEKAQREAQQVAEELARKVMQDQIQRELEEKERIEAEEKARQEVQLQLQAAKEAEERTRRELQLLEEKEAKERARREAEQTAAQLKRQKIEERQKKEAGDKARRELELKNKKEAEERLRQEAREKKDLEEKNRRDADERIKSEALELARQKIEQQKIDEEQEQARNDIAEKLRLAAEAQSMQEERAEAQRQAELQAEESANLAAEEQSLIDAEKARQHELSEGVDVVAGAETEQSLSEEVERLARMAAEEQGKQGLDLQAKKAADEIAEKLEEIANEKISEAANAQELAAHKAQEQVRLGEIAKEREKSRQEAVALTQARREERNRVKLEQKKQREAERKARRNNQEVAPVSNAHFYDTSRGLGMSLIGICFVVIVVLFAWTQLSSFDEKIIQIEKISSQQFQQVVKIKKLGFSFIPQPQWQFEDVVIGAQGQIKIQRINAPVDLSSLFSEVTSFKSLEFQSPVLNEEGLSWLLFGRSQQQGFEVNHVSATNVKVDSANLDMGVFDLDAKIGANSVWNTINLVSSNKEMTIELQAKEEQVQVKLNAKSLALPFGSSLTLGSFSTEGVISRNALTLSKFYGVIYDGILTGSAKLTWDKDWSLKGDIKAKQIDAAKFLTESFEDGQIEGDGKFLMQAREAKKLFPSQRMNGNFSVHNGTIRGIDMVKLLQGVDNSGTSSFKDLSGGFSYEMGKTRLKNVRLAAGLVSANGYVDVNANQDLSGRFGVDLTTSVRNVRVDLLISGALKKPHFSSSSTSIKVQE